MPVVSSKIAYDKPRDSGMRQIREDHTLHDGTAHPPVKYLAAPGQDVEAIMRARVPEIDKRLKRRELRQVDAALRAGRNPLAEPLVEASRAEVLRDQIERYKSSDDVRHLRRIYALIARVSDSEIQALGYKPQVVRAKLAEAKSAADSLDGYVPPGDEVSA